MKDLGEAENILGIRIRRYKGKLTIDQSQFAKETVAQFLYDDSMKHATPWNLRLYGSSLKNQEDL